MKNCAALARLDKRRPQDIQRLAGHPVEEYSPIPDRQPDVPFGESPIFSKINEVLVPVPVYDRLSSVGKETEVTDWMYVDRSRVVGQSAFGLRVAGWGLEPLLHDGEIAVIDPDRSIQQGDVVIVAKEGEPLARRYGVKEGKGVLEGDGTIMAVQDVSVVGVVIGICRYLK